ncbi:MAG: STAS-like domain-containing protein [Brevundimonas sp.]|uniref:STAS-like domain-containing protein n=1 Tax=Brevundimonas sp. TaxID=1871086 RepID=UPI0027202BEA|nr:STAS-like domain-containing protein [Brevundimonas sp.]MDO9607443.1 STAS-like domain-containing protein [Brevundimonas sp.]
MTKTIRLAADFNPFPFGRYPSHGEWSGQRFREEWLKPALLAGEAIEVDLDGARGLSPSFLEEAFGGLVRGGFAAKDLISRVRIKSDRDPTLVDTVLIYIRAAKPM